jgi:GNAT superfamily N-acetyltransferase
VIVNRDTALRLARALPDIPRYLETRSMLLSGDCEILGLEETADALSFVARDPVTQLICVAGRPRREAVSEAVYRNMGTGVIVVQTAAAAHVADALPDWSAGPAVIHRLASPDALPDPSGADVRLLDAPEIAAQSHIPEVLRSELGTAALRTEIAAAFADGKPVSFCYAGSITETLWDVSIDTLEGQRRLGNAAACVSYCVQQMRARGKEPVWGAMESNPASLGLARKLGFVAVDRLFVLEAPTR